MKPPVLACGDGSVFRLLSALVGCGSPVSAIGANDAPVQVLQVQNTAAAIAENDFYPHRACVDFPVG